MITVKTDFFKIIPKIFYDLPKEGISFVMDANLRSKDGILGFFILSFIITGFSFYVIMISTTDVVVGLIPGTELVQIKVECSTVGDTINDISVYTKFLVLLIGPIWVFLLRQIRNYEVKKLIPKYYGSRVLTFFLWIVVVLFIADNVMDLGCVVEREPGMYLAPPPPIQHLITSFFFAIFYGGIFVLFTYLLDVFLVPKLRKNLTK